MLQVMSQILLRTAYNCFGYLTKAVVAVRALFVFMFAHMFTKREIAKNEMNCVNHHAVHLPEITQSDNARVNLLSGFWKMFRSGISHLLCLILLAISLLTVSFSAQAVPAGTIITNTATADFVFSGAPGSTTSNPVTITTTSLITPTASTVTLYRHDTTASFKPTVVTQNATTGPPGAVFVSIA